jgi:glutamine---fructose-6-phosphate transaminase (isomerizing)
LYQLQNRGYDSAGIASICGNDSILVHKHASDDVDTKKTALSELDKNIDEHKDMTVGIAHTRWATHGPKTDINSHPHLSNDKQFAIVHNGIVENFTELRKMLQSNGFHFRSQTDTEVVVNLISHCYNKIIESSSDDDKSTVEDKVYDAIQAATTQMHGTWALSILCTDSPNTLYFSKFDQPLLFAQTTDYVNLVSEESGFCGKVNKYMILEDNDIGVIKLNKNSSEDEEDSYSIDIEINQNPFESVNNKYEWVDVTNKKVELTPSKYPHWTLKEINEQPDSLHRAIQPDHRLQADGSIHLESFIKNREKLIGIENLILLGCGTSYYAGCVGLHYFKDIAGFSTVQVFDGGEFGKADFPRDTDGMTLSPKTGLLLLSQSGETKDLHRCIKIAKANNIAMMGVVNVENSMIAREVDSVCYLNAGREVGVASTKSFTSQVTVLSMIACWFAQERSINVTKRKQYTSDLFHLSEQMRETIDMVERPLNSIVTSKLFDYHSCFHTW